MSISNPTPPHTAVEPASKPLERGASIGRYLVLGLVGRGGMGEVYAAFDPELDRKVAVKLLRIKAGNGVSLTEGRQRTLREAQAIARLSHPNVVVVFDVGTFGDQVFIAMEFVEGNTVTFWLEQRPRTWKEVLRVFIAAGRGLIAAHEKGLVHRDFKPDNVMVDKDGEVRVMDFGLARQMSAKATRRERRPRAPRVPRPDVEVSKGTLPVEQGTLVIAGGKAGAAADDLRTSSGSDLFDARLTRTGAMMGTPAYMAPEQFFGAETDARTDQFSFCVALYEALYGERPFEGKRLTELTANVVQGTVRAAPAGTKIPSWIRKILLRGLRSAAAERYPTMGELLDDLGKDPRAKWRRRALAAAVVLAPMAIGFGVRQSLLSRQVMCTDGADKLAGVWELHPPDKPETPRQSEIHAAFMRTGKSYAANVYETVSRELTSYAESWSKMYQQTCQATHVHHEQSAEVLDLRMACLNERLDGLHALTDVFASATSEVVENAVSATNALSTLDHCADVPTLRAVVRPPDDPAKVATVAALRGRLAAIKARFDAGNWTEPIKQGQKLVEEARTVGYQPLTAEALLLLGRMFIKSGQSQAAERSLREAFTVAEASRHDEIRAEAAEELVFVIGYQGRRFSEAHSWEQIARAILKRLGGHERLHAWILNDLGCVLDLEGRYVESIQATTQAIELKKRTLGADHTDVAISEMNLAIALKDAGRPKEALSQIEAALAVLERGLGAAHPDVAMALINSGEILSDLGRYREARVAFEHARTTWERELGPDSALLGYAFTGIGLTYLAEGNAFRALAPLERGYAIRKSHDPSLSRRAETAFALAQALWESARDRGRVRSLIDEAIDEYSKSALKDRVTQVREWLKRHAT